MRAARVGIALRDVGDIQVGLLGKGIIAFEEGIRLVAFLGEETVHIFLKISLIVFGIVRKHPFEDILA